TKAARGMEGAATAAAGVTPEISEGAYTALHSADFQPYDQPGGLHDLIPAPGEIVASPERPKEKTMPAKPSSRRAGASRGKRGAAKAAKGAGRGRTVSAKRRGAVAQPTAVLIVNMIPKSLSNETQQDSEPHLTVNPANPNQIVGTAFTPDPNGGSR